MSIKEDLFKQRLEEFEKNLSPNGYLQKEYLRKAVLASIRYDQAVMANSPKDAHTWITIYTECLRYIN